MNTADSPSDNPADRPAEGLERQLADYLLSLEPSCLVLVGEAPGAHWWRNNDAASVPTVMPFASLEQCLDTLPLAEDDASGEASGHCIALMQFEPEKNTSETHDLAAVLGQAVRRFPERLIVSIDTGAPDDADFFAFGFRKLQLEDQGPIRLFEYCLSEYKQAPDWLNARNWANPARFELDDDQDFFSDDSDDDDEEE